VIARAGLLRGAAALAALAAASCGAKSPRASDAAAGPAATPVAVATAVRADVPVEIRAIGSVEPAAYVVLKPHVAGIVVDLKFEEGSDVRTGDPLVVLDSRPFEASVKAAEAELARDKALAADARQAKEENEGALLKSAVSRRSTDQARAASAAADALVQRDEAALERARLDLEYSTVRAPFDGRTGKLSVRRGSVVKADETELVSLAQVTPIRVAFSVPEPRLAEVRRAGADGPPRVLAQVPGTDAPVEGKLTFLDNSVEPASGTFTLMATFANEDRALWPGQFVQVSLTTGVDHGVVLAPTRAVQTGQKGTFVFVVQKEGTVEMRQVDVARTTGDSSVIRHGVEAGETVVVDGQLRLVPGARIEVKDKGPDKSP